MTKNYEWVVPTDCDIDFGDIYFELENCLKKYYEQKEDDETLMKKAVQQYLTGFDDIVYYTMPYHIKKKIQEDFKEFVENSTPEELETILKERE